MGKKRRTKWKEKKKTKGKGIGELLSQSFFFLLLLLLNCLEVGVREPIFLRFLVTLYFVLWQTWQYIKFFYYIKVVFISYM